MNHENFEMVGEAWIFFSRGNFYRRFRIWTHNWQKFCNLTRGRQFVHFWHFREDSSDQSQTLPEYRERHFHQKSRKKIGHNYGHLAIIGIWNLKNCENFKSYVENCMRVSYEKKMNFLFNWQIRLICTNVANFH